MRLKKLTAVMVLPVFLAAIVAYPLDKQAAYAQEAENPLVENIQDLAIDYIISYHYKKVMY